MLRTDPRLMELARRILDEFPPAKRAPLVISETREAGSNIRGPRNNGEFVPLASTGGLAVVTDTDGRSAPAEFSCSWAQEVRVPVGSPVDPYASAPGLQQASARQPPRRTEVQPRFIDTRPKVWSN